MSLISRTFGPFFADRDSEARRNLQVYLRGADSDLLKANGFDAETLNMQDLRYLPF